MTVDFGGNRMIDFICKRCSKFRQHQWHYLELTDECFKEDLK
jgi:hypothetical protein